MKKIISNLIFLIYFTSFIYSQTTYEARNFELNSTIYAGEDITYLARDSITLCPGLYTQPVYGDIIFGINEEIELQNADHWTPWTYQVHNKIKKFLSDQEIIRKDYKKFDENNTGGFPKKTRVPWARRHILPFFV